MKILIAGDFVPYNRVYSQVEEGNFSCLDEIVPIIRSSDYAIVNFESPVVIRDAKPIDKTGPSLKCSQKGMECIAKAGFKCVTLANNHFRDYGQVGVEDTLSSCNKVGLNFVGGGCDIKEAGKTLNVLLNGQKLAIINACEHEWSIASSLRGGSNPLDVVSISRAIKTAKQTSDFVLVIIHGGTELYNIPTPRMKKTYRFFVEQGADAVVNHHQHCYCGYEVYHERPIFYGLGNLCFDKVGKVDRKWEEGYMVVLQFENKITFKLYPYVQCDEHNSFVRLINDTDSFETSITKMNSVIHDDGLLNDSFLKMATKGKSVAHNLLAPYSSSFMVKLYNKGVIPSFISRKRIKLMLAHTQCESHRDVLVSGLNLSLDQE